MAKGVIEITLDKQVQSLLGSIDKSLRAFSRIVGSGGGQRGKRGGEQAIKVKVVNWNDLWTSDKGKSVVENLKKIRDNISNLSKCCDKLSKSLESFGENLRVSSRGGTGGGKRRRGRKEITEEVIEGLSKETSKGSLAELLFGKIGGGKWENLGEGLKGKLSEILEEISDEGLLPKLLRQIGGKEWDDLRKDVGEELSKILEETGGKGLAEKLIGVIGDKSWRSLKDMEKELRDMLETEKKVSLSSLIPKGSFLSPFVWSTLGGLIGSVLGGLLSQMEKVRDEIGLDILAGRELAGTMELAAEMVSKTFSTASSVFQQTTYYLAQFGIGVGEAIGQVQELFAALGEGVKDFLGSPETQKMLGYFTLLGVSAEATGGLAQQFRFLRGSVKDASKDFQSSAKMFLAAAKKMGVSVQQLVELQSRILEGMYDIILAYRMTTQAAGAFGDQITDNAKRFSVLGAALKQQGVAGAEEVSAALMNLSAATNLSWEQIGEMGITLGVMGKEAEVSTLFISKVVGEMFGLQDIFKDAQGNISGVIKKFKEMDKTSRMLAVALSPSLAPLFAVDEKVLERLDKVAKETETIQSQIKIVDSTLAAMKDKAKTILASFFAMKGVNKIISNFSKAIDRATAQAVKFLEKHEWLTKILVTLTSLSMILGTVLLELAPALLVLIPIFIVVYSVGSKALSGLIGLFIKLGEVAVGIADFIFKAFKLPFTLISFLFGKLISLGKTVAGILMFLQSIGVDIGSLFSTLKGAIAGLLSSLGSLSGVLAAMGGILAAYGVIIIAMGGSFLALGGIITWVSTIMASWLVMFSAFAGLVYGVIGVVKYLAENLNSIKVIFGKLISTSNVFVQNLKEAWEVLRGILMGEKSLGDLLAVLKKLFSKESLSSLWDALKEMFSSKEFQDLVVNLLNVFIKSFIEGFKLVWEFIYKFITGGGLHKIYEAIKNTLLSALQGVGGDFWVNFLAQFSEVVASIADLLSTIIVDIAKALPSLIFIFLNALVEVIFPTVFKVAIKLLNELPPLLVKIVMSVIAVLPRLLSVLEKYLPKFMKAAANATANLFVSLINNLIANLPKLMAVLGDLIADLLSYLIDFLAYLVDSFFKLFSEIDWVSLFFKLAEGLGVFLLRIIFKIVTRGLPALLKLLFNLLVGIGRFLLVSLLTTLLAPLKPILSLFGVDVSKIMSSVNAGTDRLIENFDNAMDSLSEDLSNLIDSLIQNTKATDKNTSALEGQGNENGAKPQRKSDNILAAISNLEFKTTKADLVNQNVVKGLQQLQKVNEQELAPIWLSSVSNEARKDVPFDKNKNMAAGQISGNYPQKLTAVLPVGGVGGGTTAMLSGAWGMFWAMGKVLNVFGERLYNHFTKVKSKVEEKINAVTADASNLINNLINETTTEIKTGVSSLVSNTASILKNLWESLTTAFQGLSSVDINVSGVFDKIVSIFNEIINFLTKPFSDLIKKIEGINLGNIGNILGKVSEALKQLLDIIGSSSIWSGFKGLFKLSSYNLEFREKNGLELANLELGGGEIWRGGGVEEGGLAKKTVLVGQSENVWSSYLVDIGSKQVDILTLIATHLAAIRNLLDGNASRGQEMVVNIYSSGADYTIRG